MFVVTLTFCKFKNFCNDPFIKDIELLLSKLCNKQNVPFKILKVSVNITLDKHAPLKKRYVRANQSPFMYKNLTKQIMKRSRLRKKILNTKSDIDRKAYNKQHNYVASLLRNKKKNFCNNLGTKTNLLKKNVDFFGKYTCNDINVSIRYSKFSNELKQADIVPSHKKSQSFLRKIIDLLVSSQMFLRFMKGIYTIK